VNEHDIKKREQELIDELGGREELERQAREEIKTHRNMLVPNTGHTCGDEVHRPCDECEKAFPIQAIPVCSKLVH
jgi:hypothetical protein